MDARVLEGKVVGAYAIGPCIGTGGNGWVYEARERMTDRVVAIKVPRAAMRQHMKRRFLREGRAGRAIRHPNVCAVYDVGLIQEDWPYLVMERLDGESLDVKLARRGKMKLADTVAILVELLAALGAAHDAGILHRDVKPENVFLAAGSPSARVKLLDFGSSRLFGKIVDPKLDEIEDFTGSALTRPGLVVGTPLFMAPEQARGERDLDGRADVFAAGVLMYAMLGGQHPFMAPDVRSVFEKIMQARPSPIRTLVPSLPAEVDHVLAKALAKEPSRRFATANEFATSLQSLVASPARSRRRA